MELFDSLDGGTKDVGVARRLPPALPDEVIFGEILPRLSALDLRRLRSTCKRWNEGIGSPFLRKLWIRKQGFGEVCLVKVSTGACCAAALYDPGRKRWHPGGLELRLPAGRTKLCVGGGTGDLLCFKVWAHLCIQLLGQRLERECRFARAVAREVSRIPQGAGGWMSRPRTLHQWRYLYALWGLRGAGCLRCGAGDLGQCRVTLGQTGCPKASTEIAVFSCGLQRYSVWSVGSLLRGPSGAVVQLCDGS